MNRRVNLISGLVVAVNLFAINLSGCALPEQRLLHVKPAALHIDTLPPQADTTGVSRGFELASAPSWMDKYRQASKFSSQQRRTYLSVIATVMNDITAAEDQRNLALEQATLLGVPTESRDSWIKAKHTLVNMDDDTLTPDLRHYKHWLIEELDRRLRNLDTIDGQKAQIESLQTEKKHLQAEVKELKEQIEALTSIEQNLTVKKAIQTED